MNTKSLMPLIIFLTAIVVLTVVLTHTRTVRRETTREQRNDSLVPNENTPIQLQQNENQTTYLSSAVVSTPGQRFGLDKMTMNAAAALAADDYDSAINLSRTVLVFDPRNYTALSVLGKALFVTNRFEEAEEIFLQQSFFYKRDPVILSNLGYTQAQLQNYKVALETLQNALRYNPESGNLLLSMAGIYALDKQKNEALEYFYKASLKLDTKLLDAIDEPMLDGIREYPEFKRIVKVLELRKARKSQR
ncbi:MAG: tetratricopeptide repeat protein [Victivallaceae bacterium]|nr:tetratricopeptide repeat protein [Victivallaceae bacterium]